MSHSKIEKLIQQIGEELTKDLDLNPDLSDGFAQMIKNGLIDNIKKEIATSNYSIDDKRKLLENLRKLEDI